LDTAGDQLRINYNAWELQIFQIVELLSQLQASNKSGLPKNLGYTLKMLFNNYVQLCD